VGNLVLAFTLIFFAQGAVFADIPGTARSNERDVLRVDLGVGLSSPAPGMSAGVSVLRTFKPAHAFGLALSVSHHSPTQHYAKVNTQAYDFVWEYSQALFEGFHALRLRGGLGASNSYVAKYSEALGHKDDEQGHHVWLGHVIASVAFDAPQADLMWIRYGIWVQRPLSKDFPFQAGIFVGWVFGGQWIGIGD
jgi:hypothetical protein